MLIAGTRSRQRSTVQRALDLLACEDFNEDYPPGHWFDLVEGCRRQGVSIPRRTTDAPVGWWYRQVVEDCHSRSIATRTGVAGHRLRVRTRVDAFAQSWQAAYASVEHGLSVPDLLSLDRHGYRQGPMFAMMHLGLDGRWVEPPALGEFATTFPRLGVRSALGWLGVRFDVSDRAISPSDRWMLQAARNEAMRAAMADWDAAGLLEIGWAGHAAGLTPAEMASTGNRATEEDLLVLAGLRDGLVWAPVR